MASSTQEIKPDWQISLRFWWAFTWRSVLLMLLTTLVLDLFGRLIFDVFPMLLKDTVSLIRSIVKLLVLVWVQMVVFQRLLEKDFGNFRIALLKTDADADL